MAESKTTLSMILKVHSTEFTTDLNISRQRSEDIVNLILETTGQHFVSLVKNKDFDVAWVDDLDFIRLLLESQNSTFPSYRLKTGKEG